MWRGILIVSLLCWGLCSSQITCKNKNGASVDWYILYKVPKLMNLRTGLEYFYMDSDTTQWYDNIKDQKGVLAYTLDPLFSQQNSPNFGFISYNDEPPRTSNVGPQFGHSKGIVMMDTTTGIWLLHSTPKFPDEKKKDKFWPETGTRNAQTFICVSFPYNQFKEIGEHLQYIRAFPFDHHIPDGFYQTLKSVTKKEDLKPNDPFLRKELKSSGGKNFKSFAKYSTAKINVKDLYFYIANKLNSDLSAQTWRKPQEEDCPCQEEQKKVFRILSLKTDKGTWNTGSDHSKWCVTEDQNRKWTCIADLNRQISQHRRPGGALCIETEKVWKLFRGLISEKDCPPKHGTFL